MTGRPDNQWWKKTGATSAFPAAGRDFPPAGASPAAPASPAVTPTSKPSASSAKPIGSPASPVNSSASPTPAKRRTIKIGAALAVLGALVTLALNVKSLLGLDPEKPGTTVLVPPQAVAPTAPPKAFYGTITTAPGKAALLFHYPSVESAAEGSLVNGTRVKVLCTTTDGDPMRRADGTWTTLWDRIDTGDSTGYISDTYVLTGSNEAQVAPCVK